MRKLSLLCFAGCLVGCEQAPQRGVDTTLPDEPVLPGVIAGEMVYPSDYIPENLQVCAESVDANKTLCDAEKSGTSYTLTVPAGSYRVFARVPDMPQIKAYYSEFVTCGYDQSCPSHTPLVVTVGEGETRSGIHPGDWYANQEQKNQMGTATIAPASSPPVEETWSPAEDSLIQQWLEANSRCRGGSGDEASTMAACEERDGPLSERLREANICYGREGEYGYQMELHRCGPTSLQDE